jgi:WXG100 family type VII secretion target
MPNIYVDPALIETAEQKVADVREAFETSLASAKTAVEGCGWTGAAATAFNERFAEAEEQFRSVAEQITGIAGMLRSGRDGIVSTDEQIATGMSG